MLVAEHIEREAKCHSCFHKEACLAWMRHGKTLYDDFSYSVEGCPYYIPAADVAPAVHGRWDRTNRLGEFDRYSAHCSNCGYEVSACGWSWEWKTPYCPNCGAKMKDGDG